MLVARIAGGIICGASSRFLPIAGGFEAMDLDV